MLRTVGALVAVAVLTAGSAGPTLVHDPSSPGPGEVLSVSGRGFTPPPVRRCALQAFDRSWPCRTSDEGPQGTLELAQVAGIAAGRHGVRVCVPTCVRPWGGTADGLLIVEPASTPPLQYPFDLGRPAAWSDDGVSGGGVSGGVVGGVVGGLRLAAATTDLGLRLVPGRARPSQQVAVMAPTLGTARHLRRCQVLWNGAAPARASCVARGDGLLSAVLRVPDDARAGDHDLQVCRPSCDRPVGGSASVAVPVRTAGEPAEPRRQVRVPRLLDVELDDAVDLTIGRRLLVDVPDGDGRVQRQEPAPGTRVRTGTRIDIEVGQVPEPGPVRVPALDGTTVDEAMDRLGAVGLGLHDPPAGEGVVTRQDPEAQVEVALGSTVSVELSLPTDPAPRWPWLALAAVAVVATGTSWAARRRWSAPSGPGRWPVPLGVPPLLRTPGRLGRGVRPRVTPVPDDHPAVRTDAEQLPTLPPLGLLVRPDTRPTVLTEVHHDDDG